MEEKEEKAKVVAVYLSMDQYSKLTEYMVKKKVFSHSAAIKDLIEKGYTYAEDDSNGSK